MKAIHKLFIKVLERESETAKTFTHLDLFTTLRLSSKELLSLIRKDTIVQISGPK